jgi:hypothetical protein
MACEVNEQFEPQWNLALPTFTSFIFDGDDGKIYYREGIS